VGRQDRSTPLGFLAQSTLLDVLARVQRSASVAKRPNGTVAICRSNAKMTGASAHTAAGGCLTDRTIMPALPMPYNGGRVVIASRASPDEGRDAYAK
jgi:hypothetical protein